MPNNKRSRVSPVALYRKPPPYHQRHVMSLVPVRYWTENEKRLQLQHNRILQAGFLEDGKSPEKIIEDALLCREDWLTDVVCPSVKTALTLHIAKELIIHYQVAVDDLDAKTQAIYTSLIENPGSIMDILQKKIDDEYAEKFLKDETIEEKAKSRLDKKYQEERKKNPETQDFRTDNEIVKASIRLQIDIEKRDITNATITKYLQENEEIFNHLIKKPTFSAGENTDKVILGAAGSGKSALVKELAIEKEKMLVLATDDYRGITIRGLEAHEKQVTNQVFTKTQDSAYMLKELIQHALEESQKKGDQRPNVLIDCVTLEGWHRTLLAASEDKLDSAVAALDDVSLVLTRAFDRAENQNAGPADRGRQVNTTALLKGHGHASQYLLSGVPQAVDTKIYATNTMLGEAPPLIAVIHAQKDNGSIDVFDLEKMADFLGKTNINPKAERAGHLYFHLEKSKQKFSYTPTYKAEQLLNVVRYSGFSIRLMDSEEKIIATLTIQPDRSLRLKIENKALYEDVKRHKKQGPVFSEIEKQIAFGSKDKADTMTFRYGKHATEVASRRLLPTQTASLNSPKGGPRRG